MFENFSSLALLLILLPVIILYLLRPKPRTIKIPSLMLLFSSTQKRRSLFGNLIRDPLLFIQLIAITSLVFALANPYYFGQTRFERTIIIIDASASMASTDVAPDRFAQALNIAEEYIENSEKTSLIISESTPVLLLKDSDRKKAQNAIIRLKPKAAVADLNEAMLLGIDLLGNEKGKIAVISDFSGQDITLTRKIIEAKKIHAEYRQVGGTGSNVGIVEEEIEGNNLKFAVKNYNSKDMEVRINVVQGKSGHSINRIIKKNSKDFFTVQNLSGKTQIVLEPEDHLWMDNTLYISMPEPKSRKVLLLSDSVDRRNPVYIAFNSIPGIGIDAFSFDRAPRKLDYGMVVLYDYTRNSMLPGTSSDLRDYVEAGGKLVVEAGSDLQFMDIKELLPVNVSGRAKQSGFAVKNTELTADIDFGTSGYLSGTLKDGAVELASGREGPVLAYWNRGRGKVIYLGINEKWGDFHKEVSYPVFWFRLLEFASPDQNHTIEERIINANLLDEKESDISIKKIDFSQNGEVSDNKVEKIHLDLIFSLFGIMIILLELYYLKYRGDI